MGLRAFIVKRAIYSFLLILFVLTLNFVIFSLMPGDPTVFFAQTGKLTKDQADQVAERFGLGKDPWTRYTKYIYNMLTFEFGYSYRTGEPVADELLRRLPNTLLLIGLSTVFSIVLGVILGVYAAYKRGSLVDNFFVITSLMTYSFPSFWMGMLFLLIFSYYLGWFPAAGSLPREWAVNPPKDVWQYIAGRLYHLALPLAVLTLFMYGGYLLLTRACMLETLTEDYIVTARAKGLSERKVLFKHALKNASLPLVTNVALAFGFLLTGAIITEQVFTYPGMGEWLWLSINNFDYPALQALFYIIAVCVIVANFIADLLYGVIDPRIKYG